MAILGDKWWPQTAKQDGDRINKQFLCSMWEKRNERPNVGGVSIRGNNVEGMRGQWSKGKQQMSTPPPPLPPGSGGSLKPCDQNLKKMEKKTLFFF